MDCSSDEQSEEELCFMFEESSSKFDASFNSRCNRGDTSLSRCQNPMARVLQGRESLYDVKAPRVRNYSFESGSGGSESGGSYKSHGGLSGSHRSPAGSVSSDDADVNPSSKRQRRLSRHYDSSPLKDMGARTLGRNLFPSSPGCRAPHSPTVAKSLSSVVSSSPHGIVFNNIVPENAVQSPDGTTA